MYNPSKAPAELEIIDKLIEVGKVMNFFSDALALYAKTLEREGDASLNSHGAGCLGMWINDRLDEAIADLETSYHNREIASDLSPADSGEEFSDEETGEINEEDSPEKTIFRRRDPQ